MRLTLGVISPQDWGLDPADDPPETIHEPLGVSLSELARRAHAATYAWLPQQFDDEQGAFYGFYRATDGYHEPPQTVNLIAPWQLLAAYDRYQDEDLLQMAVRAASWFYAHHVESHPMSLAAGGVRDGGDPDAIWTKFTAEQVMTCLGLFARTGDGVWLSRAEQSGRFLIQARRHDFAPRYRRRSGQWVHGWDSWGRVIEALLLLDRATQAPPWREEAMHWAEHATDIQAQDGAFYLIDGEYYNSDLAADELRALVMLYAVTGETRFLWVASRFADWHLLHQSGAGAWPLTIDREDNIVMPTIGPGDVPNIGIALLLLYHYTQDRRYIQAAYDALGYTLSQQAVPDGAHPHTDDERVCWGFWSWDPYYDYTLSADQSTHHARAIWFLIDYIAAFDL